MAQIVLAWKDVDTMILDSGQPDIGISPKFKEIVVPKACMWLNEGTREDYVKALQYVKIGKPEAEVFVYRDEPDPLGQAKKDIMAM